jgi:hypothetical protein
MASFSGADAVLDAAALEDITIWLKAHAKHGWFIET